MNVKVNESDLAQGQEKGILTEYEASLIRKIDLQGKGVTQVTREDNKSKGTVSLQHSTAVRKLVAFLEEEKKVQAGGELAAEVFKLLDGGKPLSYIVTKLRADPEEVQRLYKSWTRMKSEDLNQPSVPAAVADQGSRLTALEVKVKAGESGEDSGLVDYEGLRVILDIYLEDLKERLDKLCRIPIESIYRDHECSNCHSKHLVAIRFKCTQCDQESWWGYFPKK